MLGGSNDDYGIGLALDALGRAVLTGIALPGSSQATSFWTTSTAYARVNGGVWDVFVTQLSADGSQVRYSTLVGGTGYDAGYAMAVAPNGGKIAVTGYTDSNPFPTTGGAFRTSAIGSEDVFVFTLDPTASGAASLRYSTYLGSSGKDIGWGIRQ